MKYFSRFPFGLFVGLISAISLAWVFDAGFSKIAIENFVGLTGILAAFLAGFLALSGISWQINSSEEIDKRRLVAERLAANSVLPLALSQMTPVAKRGAEICMDMHTGQVLNEALTLQISLPAEVIPAIKEAIKYATPHNGERLANLVRVYQVLFVRTEHWLRERYSPLLTQYDQAVAWAVLYRLIEDCFDYSRNEVSDIPSSLTNPNLHRFFRTILRASQSDLDQVLPEIQRREAASNIEMF